MKEYFKSHQTPREAVSRAWKLRVGLGGGTEGAWALACQRERREGGSRIALPPGDRSNRNACKAESKVREPRFRPRLRLKALGSSAPAPPDPPLPPRASLSRHSGQKISPFFKGHARFRTKGPDSPGRNFKVYFTIP